MTALAVAAVELVASGLGWPEGPTVLPDGRVVLVESYRSQLTAIGLDGVAARFAYVAGAPNSCVLGADGLLYLCQNGGTCGPWRAAEMTSAAIQRVAEGGRPETLLTGVDGVRLNGPNDLVFAPNGHLFFTDPGTYNPADPDPSYIYELMPNGTARVAVRFEQPTFPNGLAIESDGSIVWGESYTGRVVRQRPDGSRQDLGRLPGDRPTPDGMKIGADARLYVTDIAANGIHIVAPDGTVQAFIPCDKATTNCVFAGEILWITNAGVLAEGTQASYGGTLCRIRVPGGGAPTFYGSIASGAPA